VSRSVITVQREFRARFRKDAPCVFSKPYTKLTLHCNHRSGHLKTEHTESLFPATTPSWKLAPRPRSKHEKRTAGSAWETWTVAFADGVHCARIGWEINFLLTFETAPFFCVYTLNIYIYIYIYISHYYKPCSRNINRTWNSLHINPVPLSGIKQCSTLRVAFI